MKALPIEYMYLIVVGAEVEGQRFVDIAVEQGHEVTLIEKDEEKARRVLKTHSVRVLQGILLTKVLLKKRRLAGQTL